MSKTLRERVMDEADLCRNEGADDIARLLDEVAAALADHAQAEPVYQVRGADGRWIDQERKSYDYNAKHGQAVRVLYTARQPAAQPVAVPDGYALVPVELTDEMLAAGAMAHHRSACHDLIGPMEDAYRAMLSAAPKVQQ